MLSLIKIAVALTTLSQPIEAPIPDIDRAFYLHAADQLELIDSDELKGWSRTWKERDQIVRDLRERFIAAKYDNIPPSTAASCSLCDM